LRLPNHSFIQNSSGLCEWILKKPAAAWIEALTNEKQKEEKEKNQFSLSMNNFCGL